MSKIALPELKKKMAQAGIDQLDGRLDDEAKAWLQKLTQEEEDPKNIMPDDGMGDDKDLFFEDEVPVGPSGFKGLRDFCRVVAYNKNDPRLVKEKVEKSLESGDPEKAGVLVPPEYSKVLIKMAIEKAKIFPLCDMTKMTAAEQLVPVAASLDESGGKLYGGIDFSWTDELSEKQEKDFTLQRVRLRARTAAALCKASNSLLEDSSPRAEKVIRSLFSDAFANFMDNQIVNGKGAGRGVGILSSPCLYTVAKESGQGTATIVWKNITKMMTHMYPDGQDYCAWLIGNECLDEIWDLNIPIGTGGSSVMIASGTGQEIKPKPTTLLSRPIIWNSQMQALGKKGDIALVDLRRMLIGMRKQLTIDVSIHVYFTTNHTLFRIESRLDFQPVLPSTMKTRTNFEVAPFVTLQART